MKVTDGKDPTLLGPFSYPRSILWVLFACYLVPFLLVLGSLSVPPADLPLCGLMVVLAATGLVFAWGHTRIWRLIWIAALAVGVLFGALEIVSGLLHRPARQAQTQSSAGNQAAVSVTFMGFTNLGPSAAFTAVLTPATNQGILGPVRTTLPGPTNVSVFVPGGTAVVFQYTNSSAQPTICAVQSMEYHTDTGWQTVPVPTTGAQFVIAPGTSATQTLPVGSTNTPWRIKVFCIEQATGTRRELERVEDYGRKVVTGQNSTQFSGRKYMVTSGLTQLR